MNVGLYVFASCKVLQAYTAVLRKPNILGAAVSVDAGCFIFFQGAFACRKFFRRPQTDSFPNLISIFAH